MASYEEKLAYLRLETIRLAPLNTAHHAFARHLRKTRLLDEVRKQLREHGYIQGRRQWLGYEQWFRRDSEQHVQFNINVWYETQRRGSAIVRRLDGAVGTWD